MLEIDDCELFVQLGVVFSSQQLPILVFIWPIVGLLIIVLPQKLMVLLQDLHICDRQLMRRRSLVLFSFLRRLLTSLLLLLFFGLFLELGDYLLQRLNDGSLTH